MEGDRTLVLLRHAKSDWSGDEPDRERPLAPRGRRQAPDAGRWLASRLPGLDLAVVSPAARARATWDLVAAELAHPPPRQVDARMYAASDRELLEVVTELSDRSRTVVLVGHNPGLEELVERLTGEWVTLPTSAIAVIDARGSWAAVADGHASLRTAGRPPA